MFALPFLPSPSLLYVRPLNALLKREAWARERLVPHAGKVVRLVLGPVETSLLVQLNGLVVAAGAKQIPDVTLVLPASRFSDAMSLLAKANPQALADLMQVQGDAGLANVVSMLAANLRPDPEHELAAIVGDAAAVRLVELGRAAAQGVQTSSGRLAANLAEYASEEAGLVVSRSAFSDLAEQIGQLTARLDSLDARLAHVGMPRVHRSVRGA
jgi:ubiquinone biosynthesis protein UbiJ